MVVVGLAHTVGRRLSLTAQSYHGAALYQWYHRSPPLSQLLVLFVLALYCPILYFGIYYLCYTLLFGTISAGPKLDHSLTNYLLLLPFLLKLPICLYVGGKKNNQKHYYRLYLTST